MIKMRMCFLSPYPPQSGGVPTQTDGLVRMLAKRHNVCVITYGRKGRKGGKNLEIFEIPVVNLKVLRGLLYFIGAIITLLFISRKKKIDIIHAQYMHPLGTAALLSRKIMRKKPKVVITAHGSDLISLGKNRVVRRFLSWLGNSGDKLICVSKYLGSEASGIGVNPEKIKVVYNGLDASDFPKKSKGCLRKELGLPKDRKIITFAGSLSEDKGADIFVILAKHLLEKDPDMLFVLVGGGPEKKRLARFCARNKIKDSVRFAGPKNHKETLEYIKSSDVLVVPSRIEGFGMTALEGMRLGVPVAASKTGALPEILSENSLTENLPVTVMKILKTRKFRDEMINENKRLSRKFSLEMMVNETEKAYRNVKRSA